MSEPFGPLTRRGFLAASVAAAVAAACGDDDGGTGDGTASTTTTAGGTSTETTTTVGTELASDPFTIGVASGDPLDDSVILWTRLDAAAEPGDADVAVMWEVATDAEMTDIVATGDGTALAALGHSVHVDATGLEADTFYWYRFTVGEFTSPVGRTRTLAAPGTTPDSFRFAFSSCQNWEQGYYAAYRDVAETDDLDAFVFLGDYIYEYATGGYSDDRSRSTEQDFETETVDQYRQRYALYRSDPLLQNAHAHVPWIITWDDHEVDNDYAGAISQDDDDEATFLERRAAAYQVWYEFMPVRLEAPDGPDFAIHRSIAHGDLLRFHVLDTRQYRSDQQRGEPFVDALGDAVQVRDEELQFSEEHTMLGDEQFDWLVTGVAESTAIWDVLAQQVLMLGGNAAAGSDPPVGVIDTWDGYAGERRRLLEAIGVGAPDGADNLVVLTGDFHSAAVGDLRADPFDPDLPTVGVEFMATSISSSFFDDDEVVEQLINAALSANPHLKYFDARRGYTRCEVTPDRWEATYRGVVDQFDENSAVETISTWAVEAGTPSVEEVT